MIDGSGKKKLIKLFEFLKQFNNIKNPVMVDVNNQQWIKWMDSIPEHETIKNNIYNFQYDSETLFSIDKPKLRECPLPPEEVKEWLEKGWNDISKEVVVKQYIEKIEYEIDSDNNEVSKLVTINLEEDNDRLDLLNIWKELRAKWAYEESKARKADAVYNELYSLYSILKKEAEALELVLGDGILSYCGNKEINHPILLQAVNLVFDANIPQFKINISEERGPELYKSLFSNITESNYELLSSIYEEFETSQFTPYGLSESNSFLTRLSHALASDGIFLENSQEYEKVRNYPQIYRRPVLFVRKRNLGFGVAIDSIIEDIGNTQSLPGFLCDIVGIENDNPKVEEQSNKSENNFLSVNGIDEDILLTKPANAEQLAVAKHLERNGAVLVQGPPGTGKTHTIANMVGHLLSQGKSILITSYSEKALSVLKEKVVEELQSLCLSLLATTEGRREMENSLDVINENRSTLEPSDLKSKVESLGKERKEIIDKLNNLKMDLKNARINEYRAIIISGEEYKPIDAAKYINKHRSDAAWMPTPIILGKSLSLSEEEISELYSSNIKINLEEEKEYDSKLPNLSELITPIEFNEIISQKNTFSSEKLSSGLEYWNSEVVVKYTISELNAIRDRVNGALVSIDINTPWVLETIQSAKEDTLKNSWSLLIDEINVTYKLSIDCLESILTYNPQFIDIELGSDVDSLLKSIIEKLENGGKITRANLFLNKPLKNFINACRVNGNVPTKTNEFKALNNYRRLIVARGKLKNRWNRQIAVLGAEQIDDMGDDFELTCKKYCLIIEDNINWYERKWNPIIKDIDACGIKLERLKNKPDLSSNKFSNLKHIKLELGKKLIEIIETQIYRVQYNEINNNKKKIENVVNEFSKNYNSKIINGLQTAVINEDVDLYNECYESIKSIKELGKCIERRRELLHKLEITAPAWANEIIERQGEFGKAKAPANIKEAWLYCQFVEEINYRNKISIDEVQRSIAFLEESFKNNTAELAFNKAWLYKLDEFNNNKKQIQAIEGWRQLIRKIGAGKGKNAERLKAEARKLMPECQSAVPVWIMPLNKVVENFNPKENKFDVVIIDEASQADVMALVALYLGKQVIIVGDNEQVSPLAIGEKTEDMERLVKEYLHDMPNHFLYSGKFSIYDLAQASGYQPVRLKEHFRCVPEIIEYSNILSYNGQIKALRETSDVKTKPPIITYRVQDAISDKKTNQKEIEAVVSLILACCENEEYTGKTFGVITLRGEKQATLIDRLLQSKMAPIEYDNRNILCGNPANFQGDERDIIFLTMVDANAGEGPMRLTSYGTDNLYKKRYNVAVSRARDQLWLIYSMDSDNDLKSGDIRKGLIEYCKDYKSRQIDFEKNVLKAESEFEKRVMKYLIERGYNISPQWEVGSFRIDMVAIYKNKKVAIECDGERWHGEDKLEEDMNRQGILERLGWRFIRIRGSKFFSGEEAAMENVIRKLNDLDIYPDEKSDALTQEECGLKERIIVRADEIRDLWICDVSE
ncbi:AAA domain-containing protein [Clostridium estertheticum]|uniref:AAA domain-containing protein n=1 Tax=Clostridium estertheticum TaxID=238834 RepID=UPI001C6E0C3E|nr:AAA domain-containing protein [Clostridium estertheticum]MBW9154727.1 AAA family ATPase [Clostridium estertheticum]WLC82775.1 AAA family ATPase [Clostridium estertheticum]